ncbi:hypothetical protein FOA52_000706 [Chlamydomonas sp. UWO 241]|nr:hypothetical protein FOA52_000706 [Chlamydomonas sp. UWO 241]
MQQQRCGIRAHYRDAGHQQGLLGRCNPTNTRRHVQAVFALQAAPASTAGAPSWSRRVQDVIRQKLVSELSPERLDVIDESPLPMVSRAAAASGAPAPEPEELHFRIKVVSNAFEGMNSVKRHRLVNMILAEEVRLELHALALWTKTPSEVAKLEAGKLGQR